MPGIHLADVQWLVGSFVFACIWFYAGKAVIQSPGYAVAALDAGSASPGTAAERVQQLAHKRLRATSWLIGLLSSLTMSLVSLYSTFQFLAHAVISWKEVGRWLDSDDPLGRIVTCFFIATMAADIVLGLLHYPKLIDLLQGWIHHSGYTWLLLWFLSMNYTNSFFAFALCEVPTLILAVGTIYPPLRQDVPMGVSFFVTRVAYYAWAALVLVLTTRGWIRPALAVAVLALHGYWFYGWVRSYGRLRASAAKRKGGAKGVGSGSKEPGIAAEAPQPTPTSSPVRTPLAVTGSSIESGASSAVRRGSRLANDSSDCDDVTRLLDGSPEQQPAARATD